MTSVFPEDRKEDIQKDTHGKARPGILPPGDRVAWSTTPPGWGTGREDAPLEPLEVGRAAHMPISDF